MKSSHRYRTYIWQSNDWPNFKWDASLLLEPLSQLSNSHGRLMGQMSAMGIDEKVRSMLTAMSEELINTSDIEGIALNPASVRSSIARKLGIEDEGVMATDHYVEGLVEVMIDAITNCRKPLTPQRLFNWHASLFPTGFSGMSHITVANWRQGATPMQVVSGAMGHEKIHYEAPPSDIVAREMTRMIEWCNTSQESTFLIAAIAHLWFVTIHPFDDGNGRICRTLTDMILSRLNPSPARYYSMSAEINRKKKEYYEILEQTQKGRLDITEWILWFFKTLQNSIESAITSVDTTVKKAIFWERHRDIVVNERQRKMINRLWDGIEGKMTTSKWAKMCKCSQDTALRDINDLISKGMLRKSDEKGRNANYLLP